MSTKFVMIQAIGLLGTITFFLSYQCKSNKNLFRVQFISYSLYTIHLLMLGAITGGFSYILNTIRSLCLGSKNDFFKRKDHVCDYLCIANDRIILYLEWSDINIADHRQYCSNNRWIYIQWKNNPYGWNADQFSAMDHIQYISRFVGRNYG